MMLDILTKQFDVLTSAPNGIPKLRELILQHAVQGKLVPQNPSDEPVSVLLKKIATEKKKLITEGKIKKTKPLPPMDPNEVPYDLPEGWEWARLEEICSYIQRGESPQYVESSPVPVVSQKCIQWSGFTLQPARRVDIDSLETYSKEKTITSGQARD